MKKRVMSISLILFIMVFSLIIPTFAATPTYTVGVAIDKTGGVGQEKEVTFTFSLANFKSFPATNATNGIQPQNGVNTFKASLQYDDNVFYPIDINTSGGVSTMTSDGNPSIMGLNGWLGVTYNPADNGKKTIAMEAPSFISTDQDFLQVTLKVKATATGTSTVSLTDMTASDQVNDLTPTNTTVSQTITIVNSVADPTDPNYANGFGGYIRIMPGMTVAEFKKFDGKAAYANFKTEQGTALADTDFIPTGTTASDGQYSYTLIAVGDINSDGKLTVTDLSQIKGFEVGLITTLTDNQKRACDIKWDGKYTVLDRSQMRMMMVNLGDPQITVWSGTGTATCVAVTAT